MRLAGLVSYMTPHMLNQLSLKAVMGCSIPQEIMHMQNVFPWCCVAQPTHPQISSHHHRCCYLTIPKRSYSAWWNMVPSPPAGAATAGQNGCWWRTRRQENVVGGQHEPVGTGDGNDKPKSRRRRCLGVAAEIEGKGLGKTRSFCMPFVPLTGGPGGLEEEHG
jgi:hypothetical protein